MPSPINPPDAIRWEPLSPTSVRVGWRQVDGVDCYEITGGGADDIRSVESLSTVIKGLPRSAQSDMRLRSACTDGRRSAWVDFAVITSVGVPVVDRYTGTIPIIDADRQAFNIRLPSATGRDIESRITLWWQPSDQGWWANLEVPVNNRLVSGKRLAVNTGILDGIAGVLAGNIVMRTTAAGGYEEPKRDSFESGTHALRWEAT